MAVDPSLYASTGDFSGFLEPAQAAPIFEEMTRHSLVQPQAKRVEMGPTGVTIPFWDGEVSASWTTEGGKKPITKGGFDSFTMKPEKITAIFAMSAEVVRANPLNYINVMRTKVAEAFAVAFDNAALHGTNTPFGAYVDETTKEVALTKDDNGETVADAYGAVNNALAVLVQDGKQFTGGLLDIVTEPIINDSLDKNGRPLFNEATYTETNTVMRRGRVLGRPVTIASGVKDDDGVVGYLGDFSKLLWSQIGGISYDVSDQTTLDLSAAQDGSGMISLWQHNLVAVRCEAEFAIRVHDAEAFVKVLEAEPEPEAEEGVGGE